MKVLVKHALTCVVNFSLYSLLLSSSSSSSLSNHSTHYHSCSERIDLKTRAFCRDHKFCTCILFAAHNTIIITKDAKKCRKKWRGGLKETIKLMLIRPPQLQFFEDGIKITATDTKYYWMENYNNNQF